MSQSPDTKAHFFRGIRPFLKHAYWALLVGAAMFVSFKRGSTIWEGDLSYLDQGLLFFLGILLVLPLVSEMEVFGFRLRKSIEEVKRELRTGINQLQNLVTSSVAVRSDIYNVHGLPLASDRVMQELVRQVREAQGEEDGGGDEQPQQEGNLQVPEDAEFLFRVRYSLEEAINDITTLIGFDVRSVRQAMRGFESEGWISRRDLRVFDEVWSITSQSIHGHPVEDRHIQFVRETYSHLIDQIRAVERIILDDG